MGVVEIILSLLAGLGAFLIGFKILSENTEKLADGGLRRMFNKTSKSRMAGVGIGLVATAIVQSSSATTVMVVGFVNAGMMTLFQATSFIMGANIGTTVVAQIVALQAFDFIKMAMVFTCIGIFINMFAKRDKLKTVGLALAGVGLLFFGLEYMGSSMATLSENPAIVEALSRITNPVLLLLLGVLVTALIQSSAAVATIIITMVGSGIMIGNGGNSALYVILGTNIGTCVTALLSSMGANANARRASFIHLMFNVFGSVLFFVILLLWKSFSVDVLEAAFPYAGTQIAMFHTLFNVVCTLVFLPFVNVFVKLAEKVIKTKPDSKAATRTTYFIDDRLLATPPVAITAAEREVGKLAELCMDSLQKAMRAFFAHDVSAKQAIADDTEDIVYLNKQIIAYLIQLSTYDLSFQDEITVSSLHHVLADLIRMNEVADNITKYTDRVISDEMVFSEQVNAELAEMFDCIEKLYVVAMDTFIRRDKAKLHAVDEIEDKIDAFRKSLIDSHIQRLNEGKCRPQNSGIFINLVSNLERVGDHLTFVAHSIEDNRDTVLAAPKRSQPGTV